MLKPLKFAIQHWQLLVLVGFLALSLPKIADDTFAIDREKTFMYSGHTTAEVNTTFLGFSG